MEYRNLPDLTGLATLKAVVEKGGVTEAATSLHVGQPAITKRLRALEGCYGVKLFDRVGGRLQLSEAGEKVYMLAAQTLERHFDIYEDLQQLSHGLNSLRLESSSAIGEHLLPQLLLGFGEHYPHYRVISRMAYSRRIQMHIATGMVDLGLMELAPDHPDILVQKWMDDEIVLICSMNHPLANSDLLPLTQLNHLSYVLRESHSSVGYTLDEALKGVGISNLKVVMEVGSTDTIVQMLSQGKHVSFLPRFAVEERLHRGELYHLKVSGFRIQRTLWIARHRSRIDHPVADAFIAHIRS
jgi:DNA-binding transcriptional LysR family regulator